ncbi:penicillin-binding protein 1C [bacterium]|nr:penicillin-binding protein 1C [bacterium]
MKLFRRCRRSIKWWRIKLLLGSLVLLFIVGWLATPLPCPLFPDDYSSVVVADNGKLLRVFLDSNEQLCFPPDKRPLPKKLVESIIQYEDKRFYLHPGVDPLAVVRAFYGAVFKKGRPSGASTITMQIARLIEPKPRTLRSKIIEAYHAIKIELRFSKEEILRLYLGHAPYGGNIIGYRAASHSYYGVEPRMLTWAEAATFAVLPNDPSLANPTKNKSLLEAKRDALLQKLHRKGIIDEETLKLSLLEQIPDGRISFPFLAPHLAYRLAKNYPSREITSTIDFNLQKSMEAIAKEYSMQLADFGVNNLSILIAETKTGKVKAYIGSQDFSDSQHGGQVDGVFAPRSTGSILKPFLYALAFDEAMVLPESQIKDIPTFYGAFSPMNADKSYRGLVSVRSALVKSLNVPAVRLLYTYGIDEFYGFLKSAGMRTLFRNPGEYGLPLIIGGAEGTLWDITSMFAGMGNYGDFRGFYAVDCDSERAENRLISAGACYLTLEILRELDRPGAEFYWHQFENQRPIAWKTGTSYGNRDGWAIGVSPRWTIGVWTGNFDGASNPNLTGASCAGTLLFKVFNSLPRDDIAWFLPPVNGLDTVLICRESGYLAGPFCEDTIEALSSYEAHGTLPICPYHKKLFLDQSGKYQVCSRCWGGTDYREVTRIVYPPEVAQFLISRGQAFQALPKHNPKCPVLAESRSINFVYPQDGAFLQVPRGISGKYEKVIVRAACSTEDIELYWYLDDVFIGATDSKHSMPIDLSAGNHQLSLIDSEGFSKTIKFKVDRN